MPVVLKNRDTGRSFIIKLYALVLPDLFMEMFIGQSVTRPGVRQFSIPRISTGPDVLLVRVQFQ